MARELGLGEWCGERCYLQVFEEHMRRGIEDPYAEVGRLCWPQECEESKGIEDQRQESPS